MHAGSKVSSTARIKNSMTDISKARLSHGFRYFPRFVEDNFYYVDKTKYIETFLSSPKITVFTAPPYSGKTMFMSMLQSFFDIHTHVSKEVFSSLEVAALDNQSILDLYGTYPVIHLEMESVSALENDISDLKATLKFRVCHVFDKFNEDNIDRLPSGITESDTYKVFRDGNFSEDESALMLRKLIDLICQFYGKKAILLIDSYDHPYTDTWNAGREKVLKHMQSFYQTLLEDNNSIERAMLAGNIHMPLTCHYSHQNYTDPAWEEFYGISIDQAKELYPQQNEEDFKQLSDWCGGFGRDKNNLTIETAISFARDDEYEDIVDSSGHRNFWLYRYHGINFQSTIQHEVINVQDQTWASGTKIPITLETRIRLLWQIKSLLDENGLSIEDFDPNQAIDLQHMDDHQYMFLAALFQLGIVTAERGSNNKIHVHVTNTECRKYLEEVYREDIDRCNTASTSIRAAR